MTADVRGELAAALAEEPSMTTSSAMQFRDPVRARVLADALANHAGAPRSARAERPSR
jgi:hypothetical protein